MDSEVAVCSWKIHRRLNLRRDWIVREPNVSHKICPAAIEPDDVNLAHVRADQGIKLSRWHILG